VLGLQEMPELDAGVEKRDYGSWLHAALHRFHAERDAPRATDDEAARLLACADAARDELGFDEAELLPFRTVLERLAPLYVAWLQRREAEGWRWSAGELERTIEPPQFAGAALRGRIDRVDRRGGALGLIDYKTVALAELKKKVRRPLEDTQLAVYAALMRDEARDGLQAMYLAFDERDGPQEVEHVDVATTASALLDGVGRDLARIRAGAGLAALGEGRLCEHCEARGLCRRDHWWK
jgi:ATP-dependent helicase/nuclease subunit B